METKLLMDADDKRSTRLVMLEELIATLTETVRGYSLTKDPSTVELVRRLKSEKRNAEIARRAEIKRLKSYDLSVE